MWPALWHLGMFKIPLMNEDAIRELAVMEPQY
ncbi:MAG: hypothetical protein ACI8Z1_003103 [Candidatus Azotimanducaceae bacterium]|jgi:hypothetical protein